MRFLADENFPGDAVTSLRTSGHDVLWIRTDAPGITDQDVLARSLEDARVLLTFDKVRLRLPIAAGRDRQQGIDCGNWHVSWI